MTTRKRHTPEQVTLIGVSLSPGAGVRSWRRDRCQGNWAGYVEVGRQGGGVSRRLGGDELPYWPSSCVTSFVIPWMTLKLTQLSLLCPVCGVDVPPSGWRGPRRTYCSEACKQAAYRRREQGVAVNLPRQYHSGRRRMAPT